MEQIKYFTAESRGVPLLSLVPFSIMSRTWQIVWNCWHLACWNTILSTLVMIQEQLLIDIRYLDAQTSF